MSLDTETTPSTEDTGCCGASPEPTREHRWLQRLVGEWEANVEVYMHPQQPPATSQGQVSTRSVGGLWVVSDGRNDTMRYQFVQTIGFDPKQDTIVASWVDTMQGHLWTYRGRLDEAGQTLTLETEGPHPMKDGATTKFRDIIRLQDDDHQVYTTEIQGDDGEWHRCLAVHLNRR